MQLILLTLNPQRVAAGLVKGEQVLGQLSQVVRGRSAELLIPTVARLLKKNQQHLSDIESIALATGPGPFSAVRTGVVVGNSLGFALNIPVYGIPGEFATFQDMFASSAYKKILARKANRFTPIRPAYGQDPHISKAKKRNFPQHRLFS